ncbi:hypothetical protein H5410_061125 [Solanum commersonii]|uniref:Uncharacterized protein n=1 Tax=Solanum commersonii TaxID=4109 RepID=A0A9J5W7Q2_SOLCO|nr:hypothetical protein H5410_061125 [Solanum commersonii]
MLNGEWETPWNVTMEANSINQLRNSIVLSPEGKDQISSEMEQSACRRAVLRSSTIPPNNPGCEDVEGKS